MLSTFGARLVELMFRDREGNVENIVLGYDTEQNYRDNPDWYVGAHCRKGSRTPRRR